jgi:hypothetical protein
MATTVVRRSEPHDVFIGRPSKWGNPFRISPTMSRPMAILAFEVYFRSRKDLQAQIGELRGKRLGCFCKPLDCHGDVLAYFADTGRFLSDGSDTYRSGSSGDDDPALGLRGDERDSV